MVLSTLFVKLFVLCMPSNAAEAARIDYDERSKKKELLTKSPFF